MRSLRTGQSSSYSCTGSNDVSLNTGTSILSMAYQWDSAADQLLRKYVRLIEIREENLQISMCQSDSRCVKNRLSRQRVL